MGSLAPAFEPVSFSKAGSAQMKRSDKMSSTCIRELIFPDRFI